MTTLGTFEYDNLLAGSAEVVTDSVIAGTDLARGTVVGLVTVSGKAAAVDSTASDGSKEPYAIVADDVKANRAVVVYLTGEFNANALIFGGTDTVATHKRALRNIGIFIKENIGK